MSAPLTDQRLIDPPSPVDLIPAAPWETWVWVSISVAVTVGLVILGWWLKRRRQAPPPADPRVIAHAEALAALATCHDDDANQVATKASLVLRRYLAAVTGDPALFETHEELVSRHDAFQDLGDDVAGQLRQAFAELARIKYAPARGDEDPAAIHEQSRQLLESLNREFAA